VTHAKRRLRRLADTDPLTSLYNKRYLTEGLRLGSHDVEALIKLADARLYEAKQRGRDCVVAESNATTAAVTG
jgi:GGDEF domain-containing protein